MRSNYLIFLFLIRGLLIIKRKEIAINYLKFWFWIDLVSSFPYDLVIDVNKFKIN